MPEGGRTTHRGRMGDRNARLRAEPAFVPISRGGAALSIGSVARACAPFRANHQGPASQMSGDALRRFPDPAPFEGS